MCSGRTESTSQFAQVCTYDRKRFSRGLGRRHHHRCPRLRPFHHLGPDLTRPEQTPPLFDEKLTGLLQKVVVRGTEHTLIGNNFHTDYRYLSNLRQGKACL